ncbi:MAG: nucleoside kinase [Bacteroidaceae bacterium]|nr:nucleoside kinase [Bacteroidaceae bacterium]
MVKIFCVNNGETKSFQSGTALHQICKEFALNLPYEAVAARVNNEVEGLNFKVYNHKDVEFIDITSDDGMRMYVRSLTFIMMKALNDLFPGRVVRFENPISKGYYCRVEGAALDESQVTQVRERMREIINEDIPFYRVNCRTAEAIEVFEKLGRVDRVRLLKTYKYLYTSYYILGDYIDHYYEGLLPSTGYIKLFEIEKFAEGVLLRVPDKDCPTTLEDKVPQEKLQERFEERLRWHQIMGVETIGDFNIAMNMGYEVDLVNIAEALQEKRFSAMADNIKERGARVVLIAGPSSSGKTTSSKRLSVHLLACGLKPVAVSLDDFFVDREKSPRKPNGDYDFESIHSIDLPYFNTTLTKILAGEEVELPYYNFVTGRREYHGKKIKLTPQMVLVIEGTHGLNPMLTEQVPENEKFRIYVSALTSMKLDYHNYISTSDTRLLRRMVRDAKYRGFSAMETISRWPSVREGEEEWIFPYQENADVMFNSSLFYELAAFKSQAEPMLRAVPQTSREYSVARRLLRFLDYIVPLQENILPPTSVIREFLGGSTFTY